MIDWEDLQPFTVFMRQRSLSAAARELQVERATIARRIASLERDLKLKLWWIAGRGRIFLLRRRDHWPPGRPDGRIGTRGHARGGGGAPAGDLGDVCKRAAGADLEPDRAQAG